MLGDCVSGPSPNLAFYELDIGIGRLRFCQMDDLKAFRLTLVARLPKLGGLILPEGGAGATRRRAALNCTPSPTNQRRGHRR